MKEILAQTCPKRQAVHSVFGKLCGNVRKIPAETGKITIPAGKIFQGCFRSEDKMVRRTARKNNVRKKCACTKGNSGAGQSAVIKEDAADVCGAGTAPCQNTACCTASLATAAVYK